MARLGFCSSSSDGTENPRSTTLSEAQESLCVLYHRSMRLPLDDCPYWPRKVIPYLSRSTLHRCLQNYGISRLPELEGGRPRKRNNFIDYPVGYLHVDVAEVSTGEGRLRLFVAIDWTCKYVRTGVLGKKSTKIAAAFLCNLIAVVPYRFHTIRWTTASVSPTACAVAEMLSPIFLESMRLERHGISPHQGVSKVYRPWTKGQVERINRTLKEAMVKRYYLGT